MEEFHDILTGLFEREAARLSAKQSQHGSLHSEEAKILNEEIEKCVQFLNTKLESRSQFDGIFNELTGTVEHNCPLLYSILGTILQYDATTAAKYTRVKSAVHAIAILISLRSQKIKNDFKVMFTFLCISFGAGSRMIEMLNHLGLTVSWQKAMKLFDNKMKSQQSDRTKITPDNVPVMLLIDNINIYRGKRKLLRITRPQG